MNIIENYDNYVIGDIFALNKSKSFPVQYSPCLSKSNGNLCKKLGYIKDYSEFLQCNQTSGKF